MHNALQTFAIAAAALAASTLPATAQWGATGDCGGIPLDRSIASAILDCTTALGRGRLPSEDRALLYYDRGLLYHQEGQYELAVKDYTDALGWMRNFSDALAARADAYEDLGQHDKATADYQQAEQYNVDGAGALNDRCYTRAIRGRPLDRALADCSKAVAYDPDNPSFLDSRCFVRYRLGDYAGAVSDCSAALQRRPQLASSLYIRGLAKLKSGDGSGGEADVAAAKDSFSRISDQFALYGVNR